MTSGWYVTEQIRCMYNAIFLGFILKGIIRSYRTVLFGLVLPMNRSSWNLALTSRQWYQQ